MRDREVLALAGMRGPNPLTVAWSIYRALRQTASPGPFGSGSVDHSAFEPILSALAQGGIAALGDGALDEYIEKLKTVDPRSLQRDEAFAFWLNLYNAGALSLASSAADSGFDSVLRVPGGFWRRQFTIAGEELSLDGIEHGKIRRFGDPRIHGALVCGSVSCPTVRYEPYKGEVLSTQLDNQLRSFLARGGAVADGDVLRLSRVFLWYGCDFVRPTRMPTWLPASKKAVGKALISWLANDANAESRRIVYQPYDWGLRCAVG